MFAGVQTAFSLLFLLRGEPEKNATFPQRISLRAANPLAGTIKKGEAILKSVDLQNGIQSGKALQRFLLGIVNGEYRDQSGDL